MLSATLVILWENSNECILMITSSLKLFKNLSHYKLLNIALQHIFIILVFNLQYTGLLLLLFKILINQFIWRMWNNKICYKHEYWVHIVVLWQLEKFLLLYSIDEGYSQTISLSVLLYIFRNIGLPISQYIKILIVWVHIQGVS